jgi:hypothetical protein
MLSKCYHRINVSIYACIILLGVLEHIMNRQGGAMTDVNVPEDSKAARRIFGALPEIPGEDGASYEELLTRMTETVRPADLIEEMWVRDVVDLSWEILRLRRLKAGLLAGAACHGVANLLIRLGAKEVHGTATAWAAGDREARACVNGTLNAAGLSMHAVMASTLSEQIRDIETMERMTMAAEARRNAALEQIERYRAKFAMRMRHSIEEVEGVEVKRIENAPAIEAA